MDWVPVVFLTFKFLALGTAMFFAIKWHYDQRRSRKPVNLVRIILEGASYLAAVLFVFGVVYGILHYLHFLPDGLDFN